MICINGIIINPWCLTKQQWFSITVTKWYILSQSFIVFPVKTLYAYYTFLLRFLEALKNGMQTMNTTKSRWPSDITEWCRKPVHSFSGLELQQEAHLMLPNLRWLLQQTVVRSNIIILTTVGQHYTYQYKVISFIVVIYVCRQRN